MKVLDILNTFILVPNSLIKERITHKKTRIILKYLFNYIQGNQYRGPKDLEESIPLEEKIFIFLRLLIKRNGELKDYISKSLNFLKIMEIKAMDLRNFLEYIFLYFSEAQKKYGNIIINTLKMVKEMLEFMLDFLGNDIEYVKLVASYGQEFLQLNSIIYEKTINEKLEIMKEIHKNSKGIYIAIFNEKIYQNVVDEDFECFTQSLSGFKSQENNNTNN